MKPRHRSHEAIYGCSKADMQEMREHCRRLLDSGVSRGRTPIGAYLSQEKRAHRRGIGWEFTFRQWWQVWADSGKWEERGGPRGYVMCRKGDVGPYAPGNVFIATVAENSSQAHRVHDLPIGVWSSPRARLRPRYVAQRSINGKSKYLGTFGSPEEARAAYEAAA